MKLSNQIFITFGTSIASFILSFFTGILIARILGPEGKGVFALATLVPTTCSVLFSFGIENSNTFFVAKDNKRANVYISNSIVLSIVLSIILLVCLLLSFKHLTLNIFRGLEFKYFLLGISVMPFILVSIFFKGILRGLRNILLVNMVDLIKMGTLFVLAISFLLILRIGTYGAMIAYITSIIVSSLVSACFLRRKIAFPVLLKVSALTETFRFGIKTYIGNIMGFLNNRLDFYLVNFYLTTMDLGYYSISVGLAQIINYIPNSISMALLPYIASIKQESANQITSRICRYIFFLSIVMAVMLCVFGKYLILFLYGQRFIPAIYPFVFLLPGIIALSVDKTISNYIVGVGKPIICAYISGIELVFTVILDFLLIPRYGVLGASIASSIAYMIGAFMILYIYSNITKTPIKTVLIPTREDFKILGAFSRNTIATIIGR